MNRLNEIETQERLHDLHRAAASWRLSHGPSVPARGLRSMAAAWLRRIAAAIDTVEVAADMELQVAS